MNEWIVCPNCNHYSAYTKAISGNSESPDCSYECECVVCGHKFTEPYTPPFILKHIIGENVKKYRKIIADELNKKEAPTMQVTYNGFTGELVKLEQKRVGFANEIALYDLSIYDSDKQVTHFFTCVKLEDVKFFGGTVAFCG